MLRTKDAAKIGTTTFRLWVRQWDEGREDWLDIHHSEWNTQNRALLELKTVVGEAAEITKVRWDEDVLVDQELGRVLDAEGVEIKRWYYYRDAGGFWVFDEVIDLS